jgi:RNA polymerase sigma-70 factor (ECF subfamily)
VDDPDGLLVRRARRGDADAFARLVERHEPRQFTLAARVLGSKSEAEDAVQEALIRVWKALPRFREGSRFSTWLYRITLNCALDIRAGRRADPSELVAERADPRDAFAASELSGALQQALAEVEEPYRVAVVLHDVLGCSYAEIGEITGVPEGTVKSRLFRGRRDLGRLLGTSDGEGGSNG